MCNVSMMSHDLISSIYDTRDNYWWMILIETINILQFGLPWKGLLTWSEGRYQKLALVHISKYLRKILYSTISHVILYLLTKFHCLPIFLEMSIYNCIVIVCLSGCDKKNFKTDLIILIKPFSHMTKKVRTKI